MDAVMLCELTDEAQWYGPGSEAPPEGADDTGEGGLLEQLSASRATD